MGENDSLWSQGGLLQCFIWIKKADWSVRMPPCGSGRHPFALPHAHAHAHAPRRWYRASTGPLAKCQKRTQTLVFEERMQRVYQYSLQKKTQNIQVSNYHSWRQMFQSQIKEESQEVTSTLLEKPRCWKRAIRARWKKRQSNRAKYPNLEENEENNA